MNLVIVAQDFPPAVGGIQTYASALASRLHAKADDFFVVATAQAGHDDFDRDLSYEVVRMGRRSDLLVLPATRKLPKLYSGRQTNLSYHTQWQTAMAAVVSRKLRGYPQKIVAAAHGSELLYEPPTLPGILPALRRNVVKHVDHFVAVSRYTAGLLQRLGVAEKRISVVPNGTDPSIYKGTDKPAPSWRPGFESKKILLQVGRLVPRKGVDTTLRALGILKKTRNDFAYVVVGEGEDEFRLKHLADEQGLAENVHFVGRQSRESLLACYNACDIFVMPSRNQGSSVEGFGIVFLEAAACGKPSIGSTAGGIPDAVLDERTGLLVEPDDSHALAEAIARLLDDDELRISLGRSGRDRVLNETNWDTIADRVFEVLQRV